MKKILLFGTLFTLVLAAISSCSKTKTQQELLKEEGKAIERFIDSNGFTVLSEYPKDGIFKENEYFQDSKGLYIHVIDSGNGKRPKLHQTVIGRYDKLIYFKTADTIPPVFGPLDQPDEFIYGISNSYLGNSSCMGWVVGLSYISEGAEVNLIIPSSLGILYDQSNYRPLFVQSLKYRFD